MSSSKIIKLVKDWKFAILAAALVVTLAGILRITNLTLLPVFVDEAIYIRWSQIMANEATLRFLPLSDGKQPLFMWVLMFLVSRFEDPLLIGRLVSVMCGMVTTVGIFLLSGLLFKSKSVSIVASILWAISPFSFFFDRMALVDSMLTMSGVWTAYFAILTSKYSRFDLAMVTGFSLGAALLTKSPAIFFVLLMPTTWIFAKFGKSDYPRVFIIVKLVVLLLISYGIGFSMYNILRLGPNFHLIGQRNIDYVWPITHILKSPLDPLKPHFHRSLLYLWEMGPSFIYALIFLGLFNLRKNPKQVVFLLSWAFIPIVVNSAYAKVLTARYILFALPFIYILAASAFNLPNKYFKYLTVLFLLAFSFHALWIDRLLIINPEKAPLPRSERSGYLEEWTAGTGIKEVAEFIKAEHLKDPQKTVVVGTEGYFGTLPDGLQIYLEGIPNVIIIGVGLGIDEVRPSLIESKKAGNKTYLVANSSRLNFKDGFENSGLKVIQSYKKAERAPRTREIVQFGLNDTFYLFEITETALANK